MRTFLLIAVIAFTSCSHYKYYSHTQTEYSEVRPARVLLVREKPQGDAIGMVICKTNNESKAIRKAQRLAGDHGANRIYLEQSKEITTGEKMANTFGFTSYKGRYQFAAYHN